MIYEIDMIESHTHRATYYVEAETVEEAKQLAETGETIEEFDLGFCEVTSRTVLNEPRIDPETWENTPDYLKPLLTEKHNG